MHRVPQERRLGEPPLILQPKGVLFRPLEAHVNAEGRPVVLFHPGRSPVRLGQDNAAWRWVHPKRG